MEKSSSKVFRLNSLALALAALSGSLVFAGAVQAQSSTERLPGVADRPTLEKAQPSDQKAGSPTADEPQFKAPEGAEEVVATLTEIKFDGTLIVAEDKLQAVVASYLDRELTRQDIARLKYDLTKYYFDNGYVLIKVATPPQDLTDGSLQINVFTGQIGTLEVEGEELLSERSVKGLTSSIVGGEIFREQNVETALQNINDINNIDARLNLRPGKEVGTTDLRLIMERADQDVQTFNLDNYGSELTGRNIAELRLEKSNLMKQGERIGLNLRASQDQLRSVDANFSIPLGHQGLVLEADASWSKSDVNPKYFSGLDFSGKSNSFGVAVSKKLLNQHQQELTVRGGLQRRHHESFLSDAFETEDHITQIFAEASYLKRAPKYVYFASARVTKGIDLLGADDKGEAIAGVDANTRVAGDPQALILSASLFGSYLVTPNDSAQAFIRVQKAANVLLSSDMFSVGGYNNVRGFEPSISSGDNGASVSLEWVHNFPNQGNWALNAGPFFDWGTVGNKIEATGIDSTLKSVGLGFDALYSTNGKYTSKVRVDWAHTLGDYQSTRVDDNFLYARFSQTF